MLATVVSAAYYMNPKVRKLIGYPGQSQNPIYPDEAEYDLRDGLLDPVLRRYSATARWPSGSATGPPEPPAIDRSGAAASNRTAAQSVALGRTTDVADVVIVGAGASGAVAARHLAAAGWRVVCLEQGDWLNASDYPGDKREWELLAETRWSADPNVRGFVRTIRATCRRPTSPRSCTTPSAAARSISGPSGRACGRRTSACARSTGIADDWPISYDELLPFYERIDLEMGISGLGGDPMYPPGAPPPLPPIPIGAPGRKAATGHERARLALVAGEPRDRLAAVREPERLHAPRHLLDGLPGGCQGVDRPDALAGGGARRRPPRHPGTSTGDRRRRARTGGRRRVRRSRRGRASPTRAMS